MIITEFEGEQYQFDSYRYPKPGDVILHEGLKRLFRVGETTDASTAGTHAIFIPSPVTHTFGGVVFEEVETRIPEDDEFFLATGQWNPNSRKFERALVHVQSNSPSWRFKDDAELILRPIAIEGAKKQ